MKDQALKLFRSANREHLHYLWEKAKNNELEGLNDEAIGAFVRRFVALRVFPLSPPPLGS